MSELERLRKLREQLKTWQLKDKFEREALHEMIRQSEQDWPNHRWRLDHLAEGST